MYTCFIIIMDPAVVRLWLDANEHLQIRWVQQGNFDKTPPCFHCKVFINLFTFLYDYLSWFYLLSIFFPILARKIRMGMYWYCSMCNPSKPLVRILNGETNNSPVSGLKLWSAWISFTLRFKLFASMLAGMADIN